MTTNLLDVSNNLPVRIEILLPAPEADKLLPVLAEIVSEGAVAMRPLDVRHHRSGRRFLPRDLRVADIMTINPMSVRAETPVLEVPRLLMTKPFRGLPVVNTDGRVVGIVTEDKMARLKRRTLPVVDATGRLVGVCSRRDILMAAGHWNRRQAAQREHRRMIGGVRSCLA